MFWWKRRTPAQKLEEARAKLVAKGDPLASHFVLREDRLDTDPPIESYPPVKADLQWYRDHPGGIPDADV